MPAAQSSAPENAFSIMGLYIGQSVADSSAVLSETDFKPLNETRRRSGKAAIVPAPARRFDTDRGDRLTLKIGELENSFGSGRLIAIDYAPVGPDESLRLESRLKTQMGAPLAAYNLGDEDRLYVWERPAPEQSRDFGSLMTISLKTGDAPVLSVNQFSRSESFAASAGSALRAARAPRKSAGFSSPSGPVD